MKFDELKKHVFKDFLAWLEEAGIGDKFSADVWASKAFDLVYRDYQQQRSAQGEINRFLSARSPEELRAMADKKQEALNASTKAEKG